MPRKRASSRGRVHEVPSTAGLTREEANETVQKAPVSEDFSSTRNTSVPGVVLVVWGATFLYGLVVSAVTGTSILTLPVFYIGMMVAFYGWHWLAHQRWTGTMHKIHMIHHFEWFPPDRFFGDDLKKVEFGPSMFFPGYGNLIHEGPLYALIAVILGLGYFEFGLSIGTTAFAAVYAVVFGTVGVALHTSFHVKGFPLEKYQWYRELRALHYVHHLGSTQMNYAVLCMSFDKLFGSFVPDFDDAQAEKKRAKEKRRRAASGSSDAGSDSDEDSDESKPLVIIQGIDTADVKRALGAGGICAHVVGGHAPAAYKPTKQPHDNAPVDRGWMAVAVRAVIVAMTVALWFETQAYVQRRTEGSCMDERESVEIGVAAAAGLQDVGHCALAATHRALKEHKAAALVARLLILRLTDMVALVLGATSVLSASARPALALFVLFAIRQLCVVLVDLPMPPESLWEVCATDEASSDPECSGSGLWALAASCLRAIPAVLETEAVSKDLFFSAPAGVLTVAAAEVCDALLHWRRDAALGGAVLDREDAIASPMEAPADAYKGLWAGDWVSWAIVLAAIAAVLSFGVIVLALQANWTLSVLVGVMCARYAVLVADYHSEWIEALLP